MSMGCDRNGEGRDGCGRPTCGKCYPYSPQAQWANPPVRAVDRMSETVKQAHDLFEKWPQLRDVSLNAVVAELAAAEERGRRRGVEEAMGIVRDEDEGQHGPYSQLGDVSDFRTRCVNALRAALAPRDSAPVRDPYVKAGVDDWSGAPRDRECDCDSPLFQGSHLASCPKMQPRDSGKEK